MLKKLMKYDLKSVFKIWWIGAVSSIAFSIAGGFAGGLYFTDWTIPEPILVIAIFALILVFLGIAAFTLFSDILVYLRYYKSLYTDEGYLTFTLPAKRGTVLKSKVLLSYITFSATAFVLFIDTVILTLIAGREYWFSKDFVEDFKYFIEEFLAYDYYYYAFIYLALGIIIFALLALAGYLFAYGCIAIASVLVKKAKIAVAIGIYYGASSVLSFIMTIFYLFGMTSLMNLFYRLTEVGTLNSIMMLLIMLIFLLCAFCCLLYYLTLWCIDKKLNLA